MQDGIKLIFRYFGSGVIILFFQPFFDPFFCRVLSFQVDFQVLCARCDKIDFFSHFVQHVTKLIFWYFVQGEI